MPTTVAGPGYRGASPEGIHPHGWLPPQFLALGVQSRHTTVMRRSRLAWWDPGGQRTPFGLAWHTGQEIFISLYAGTRLVVPRPVRWSSSPRAFLAFAAASRSFTIGMIRSWWPWSRETASPPGSPGSVQSWLAFAPQRGQRRQTRRRGHLPGAPFFAEGAAADAPQAVRVADRWHLWHNLSEAAERAVAQHRHCLRASFLQPPNPSRSPPPKRSRPAHPGLADGPSVRRAHPCQARHHSRTADRRTQQAARGPATRHEPEHCLAVLPC